MKTIDEIKDEYAEHLADVFDRDFYSWKEMIDTDFEIGSGICKIYSIEELMEKVSIRYASQFEGRIKELEEMLVRVRKRLCIGSVGLKPLTYRISKKLINRDYE